MVRTYFFQSPAQGTLILVILTHFFVIFFDDESTPNTLTIHNKVRRMRAEELKDTIVINRCKEDEHNDEHDIKVFIPGFVNERNSGFSNLICQSKTIHIS